MKELENIGVVKHEGSMMLQQFCFDRSWAKQHTRTYVDAAKGSVDWRACANTVRGRGVPRMSG